MVGSMSWWWGSVFKGSAVVGYFRYRNTTDCAQRRMFGTQQETWPAASDKYDELWDVDTNATCQCSPEQRVPVTLKREGDAYGWPSTACLACRAITGNVEPFEDDARSDLTYPRRQS
jgi:hypothetical protein